MKHEPRSAGAEGGSEGTGNASRRNGRTATEEAAPSGEGAPGSAVALEPGSWAAVLAPRLAQFAAVARTEHVTRAALDLEVPQSTLSRALVRLEQDLGVDLFARRGRALSLTPAGRTFLGSVERALGEVERAAEEVRADADPTSGKVAFGFLHTMGSETVPGLLRAFRAEHPRVRFSLVQTYGEAMLERMRAGELDLCLTSPVPDAPDLVARPLGEQRLNLVVPEDHRLAGRRRVRLAETAEEAFVTLESGYGLRRITDDLCRQAGFRPRIAFEGEEAETLRGLVAAGLGVALLPPPAFPRPGVVDLAVTAPRAVRQIGVAWLDGHPDTVPVAAFKRFLLSRRGRLLREH
ncbi:LysR family transcriptional regulator [Streptomyces sp. NA04227]|uniref:LysR family transcriptional regulator n=1 Tax=Streptomyces sp. NA04227 TaxID=2742136 RepID=UPI0015905249|nr:LysR family transcriptional regulator [Streptomyces sp. NA04227]QKW06627.1 LysR family transcriptional regulator [Streptomyces sp. NA04227]